MNSSLTFLQPSFDQSEPRIWSSKININGKINRKLQVTTYRNHFSVFKRIIINITFRRHICPYCLCWCSDVKILSWKAIYFINFIFFIVVIFSWTLVNKLWYSVDTVISAEKKASIPCGLKSVLAQIGQSDPHYLLWI